MFARHTNTMTTGPVALFDTANPRRSRPVATRPPTVRKALAELRGRGLDEVVPEDLEVYRLVMQPASFRQLCHRLDTETTRRQLGLPFGVDVDAEWRADRRRAWVTRPNGEPFPLAWTIHPDYRLPGRLKLTAGREFSVTGERGRFRFRHAVTTDTGECWVEAWDREGRWRSIRPERIRVVHTKTRTRRPLERLR